MTQFLKICLDKTPPYNYNARMQQSVIFSILMILSSRRKVSRDYLAERFSISKRTVSRYLGVLEDAGVPIVSASGVNGGVSLADDYMIDRTHLTEAESMRIKDALERTADDYGDGVNRAVIEKLDCVDKARERDMFVIKQDELYIDCDYEQAQLLRPKIKAVRDCIEQKRVLEIKYTDANGYVSFRSVEPYTLVFKAGAWYLYAMCKLRGDFRLFKLTRISDLRRTSKSFSRVESHLVEKLGLEFYNEMFIDLEFEFFPASSVKESVVDWLGISAISERGTKLVARAEVPDSNSTYKKLLSYGSSIKVLNPPELAERLLADAKLMLRAYDSADS